VDNNNDITEYDVKKLNSLHMSGESVDSALFSEQRSNIMLVTGNHYQKKNAKYLERLRSDKDISNETKIRLTKNHIQKITKIYVNGICAEAPMTQITPRNEKDIDDQKSAELRQSCWKWIVDESELREKVLEQLVPDFVEIGELFVKLRWDNLKGKMIQLGQEVDPLTGQVTISEKISGRLEFDRLYAFDCRRDPTARSFTDCMWWEYDHLENKSEMETKYSNDEKKSSFITESSKDQFVVFDTNTADYESSDKKVQIREFYFRPNINIPNGYYFITTEKGILEQGELPLGIFPIYYVGFDRIPTSPRCQSIIKQARPYQAEVNRSGSKMAEHQVTVGDDKLLIPMGTRIAKGGQLDGVRAIQYQGLPPTILSGRDGSQYLTYMNSQISEMYAVCGVPEFDIDKENTGADAYNILYKTMREKKRFSAYAEKFELFLKKLTMDSLKMFEYYAPKELMIPIVGKNELMNVEMLKDGKELSFQIKIEPRSDDVESMFGKQLALNHTLQYVGAQLSPTMIGQIIRAMPFANMEQALSDLTLDYDNITNIILALDKGKYIAPRRYENHEYIISKLQQRMGQVSFSQLPPFVQEIYNKVLQEHEQIMSQIQIETQQANSGYIPTGGFMVGIDYYINYDPKNPTATKRAKVPYESLDWLMKRLEKQGMTQQNIAGMSASVQSDIAQQTLAAQQMAQQMPPVVDMGMQGNNPAMYQ